MAVRLTSSTFRPTLHNVLFTRHLGTSSRPAKLSLGPSGHNLKANLLHPKFFAGRGIVTETPVLSRPSQSETWKRYAITAVRLCHTSTNTAA